MNLIVLNSQAIISELIVHNDISNGCETLTYFTKLYQVINGILHRVSTETVLQIDKFYTVARRILN